MRKSIVGENRLHRDKRGEWFVHAHNLTAVCHCHMYLEKIAENRLQLLSAYTLQFSLLTNASPAAAAAYSRQENSPSTYLLESIRLDPIIGSIFTRVISKSMCLLISAVEPTVAGFPTGEISPALLLPCLHDILA